MTPSSSSSTGVTVADRPVPDAGGASGQPLPGAPSPGTKRDGALLRWSDAVIPLLCIAVIAAEQAYLASQNLDFIERRTLDAGRMIAHTLDHVRISAVITLLVMAIAVPFGVVVTRQRTQWMAPFVLGLGNIGQAAPTVGLLAVVGSFYIGFWAVVLVLTGYTVLAVLRNTIVGLQQVDRGVLDAARGMGMSPAGRLFRVELPLAVPVIAAGARTALVLAVATVPLGANLNAGGLGFELFGAIKTSRPTALFAISLYIAVLALLVDWMGGLLQRAFTPRGIRVHSGRV